MVSMKISGHIRRHPSTERQPDRSLTLLGPSQFSQTRQLKSRPEIALRANYPNDAPRKTGANIMAYDLHRIFLQVTRHLEMTPSMSLTQLVNNIGTKRHTIMKAVKNATGLTFREFRGNVLLKHACDLLKDESNRTIKEVAFALGYRSQGSLSRFIRIATGYSAKKLKNENN
jgi:transcriptional regulator GlxA family with amidase domain